jgi:hypothetical protein
MAIFTDPKDQARQEQRIQFQQATGANKTALALMGYNDRGNQNMFGKIYGTINPLYSIAGREVAKAQFGEDSDVGRQLRATDQEFYAKKAAQGKFLLEAGVIAATAGAGAAAMAGTGAAAGAAAGAGTAAGTAAVGTTAGAGIGATAGTAAGSATGSIAGMAGNLTSILGSGGNAVPAMMGSGSVPSLPTVTPTAPGASLPSPIQPSINDPYSKALNSDAGQKLMNMKEESNTENTKDELNKKLTSLDKSIPLIGSGIDYYQKSKAHGDAEKSQLKKALGRTVKADYNLL